MLASVEHDGVSDQVAVEDPLEIRIGGEPVAVTMRTPGHDEELALGFCVSEGLAPTAAALPADLVSSLPERLHEAQRIFAATGGLHATGLFDVGGDLLCVREDVGRHNAMDKVVGWAFAEELLPLSTNVLCISGRISFELVQKAAVAGCPVLVAVGAPSSLAVELAGDRGVTLCGWVRESRLTVYTEPWRIV